MADSNKQGGPASPESARDSPKIVLAAEDARRGARGPRAGRRRSPRSTPRSRSRGIEYVFFQQVSITGRVMGKGVVASLRSPRSPRRATSSSTAPPPNLLTDRQGNYIGFGPEESELAAIADLDTFARPPLGRTRRPGLLRLLRHRDRRAARRRPAPEPEAGGRRLREGARAQLPDRDRARDDVAAPDRGRRRRGRHQALLLPHPPVRGAASGAPRRGRLRQGAWAST